MIYSDDIAREHTHIPPTAKRNVMLRVVLVLAILIIAIAGIVTTTVLLLQKYRPWRSGEFYDMQGAVSNIKSAIYAGKFGKHAAYETVAEIVDTFGPRLVGSEALDKTLQYVADMLKREGFEKVSLEPVANITHWKRNSASLTLLSPYVSNIPVLALGTSVPTPPEGITAEVIVVSSYDDLEKKKDQVKGKIVLFNVLFVSYGQVVDYRVNGAAHAAKFGAVATLVRSAASFSIRSPHTGVQRYQEGVIKIPTASVSLEDADMFARVSARGTPINVTLFMNCENLGTVTHHNVMGEFTGSKYPNEVIVLGGHMDSWDVGQGAMDDMGGAMVCMEAVRTLIKLGIRPLRTVRFVGWVDEEVSGMGAEVYHANHPNEHVLAMESDMGTFVPKEIHLSSNDQVYNTFLTLFDALLFDMDVTVQRVSCGATGADVESICESGVPALHVYTHNDKYFWYHHSMGDTVSVLNPDELDMNVAFIATMVHAVANMKDTLPKTK